MSSVSGYPRWQGELSSSPRIWSIVFQDARRAYNDQWVRSALILAFGWAVITLGTMFSNGTGLTVETYLNFLSALRWAGVVVAAIMAGVALLDDHKRGALELYLSRSVTRWSYLTGKVLAVLAMTFLTIFLPAAIFYGLAFVIFETLPGGWAWVILGAAGYAAIWAIVIGGLGLGISCVVRSSRAATIILAGGFAMIEVLVGEPLDFFTGDTTSVLSGITRSDVTKLGAPSSALKAQAEWLFNIDPVYSWPWWWGAISLAIFAAIGWTLLWLRHPRLRGVE